jgi:hypothetical protein
MGVNVIANGLDQTLTLLIRANLITLTGSLATY